MRFNFCPKCAAPLVDIEHGGMVRQSCSGQACDYVHWDNPIPVVAAIVEHENGIVVARNKLWKFDFYGLITGFLEKSDSSPEAAIRREVMEELGLEALEANFIGHYPFAQQNQLLLAYHVPAQGEIVLGDELSAWKRLPYESATYWPAGTGFALRDWLRSKGYDPQVIELPKRESA